MVGTTDTARGTWATPRLADAELDVEDPSGDGNQQPVFADRTLVVVHSRHPMEKTLQVLNLLEREGTILRYAIGGAMAATFYAEPVLTFDLDVFVLLPPMAGPLLTLTALYEDLRRRAYIEEEECVTIEGVPVQFLPAYNALIEEALSKARDTYYEQTPTRVLRAEHLIAIAVQTGREKDRQRVRLLMEHTAIDRTFLEAVLARHGLEAAWKRWIP